ncbi:hypothetical protein B0H11DRAFT_2037543 [Mycena galericulata]|nr:hypothetical protein B0H11DRAFT_2037543 [Mycena galericulata]
MLCFQDLPVDIIFSTFAFCDICTVISVAQTCRHLYDLAFQKTIWLGFLHDLNQRHFLDPISNLRDLATRELIELVKRLITGPETWSSTPDSQLKHVLAKKITLHPSIFTGPGIRDWQNQATLLPDGRHVLFGNWNTLECWSVEDDRLVWARSPTKHAGALLGFDAEVVDTAHSLVVVVCEHTEVGFPNRTLEVVNVDLRSGTSDLLFAAYSPSPLTFHFYGRPTICGEFVVISARPNRDVFLVLNWKTRSAFLLVCQEGWRSELLLFPRHVLLKTMDNTETDELRLLSCAEFIPHWTQLAGPVAHLDLAMRLSLTSVPIAHIPALVTQRIELPNSVHSRSSPPSCRVSVRADPLRESTYRVWVYLLHQDDRTESLRVTMRCYRLSCGPGTQVVWRESISANSPAGAKIPYNGTSGITYSGHALALDDEERQRIMALPSVWGEQDVDLVDCGDYIDVSAYSGAVTYATFNSIVILYFK